MGRKTVGRTLLSSMMRQNPSPATGDLTDFVGELRRQGVASKTVDAYTADLASFARWFADSTGDAFSARAVTPTDLLDSKGVRKPRAFKPGSGRPACPRTSACKQPVKNVPMCTPAVARRCWTQLGDGLTFGAG
jgi:hypothetical protein